MAMPATWEQQLGDLIGKPVQSVRLDRSEFEKFKKAYKDNRTIDDQKRLEYYVSVQWLQFTRQDVFIDIAAQDCPFAFYVRKTFGCRVYRQDLYYLKPGVHGMDIGGDAANLPLANGSVTKLTLHNSFEHFERDSDIRFIHEAQRVLAPGGSMCIVPVFFSENYVEETDAGWTDEQGVKHLWGIGARFARHYDIAQFKQRVVDQLSGFGITVYRVEEIGDISSNAYLEYFAVFEKQK